MILILIVEKQRTIAVAGSARVVSALLRRLFLLKIYYINPMRPTSPSVRAQVNSGETRSLIRELRCSFTQGTRR